MNTNSSYGAMEDSALDKVAGGVSVSEKIESGQLAGIKITCPDCDHTWTMVTEDMQVKCPQCGKLFRL
ncbi:MAG: CpXC domain-containing protein [Lachnospiraceae bacterium]|nr:CpXC domain-containing protein [Lachnospiraceae bacterium]